MLKDLFRAASEIHISIWQPVQMLEYTLESAFILTSLELLVLVY